MLMGIKLFLKIMLNSVFTFLFYLWIYVEIFKYLTMNIKIIKYD